MPFRDNNTNKKQGGFRNNQANKPKARPINRLNAAIVGFTDGLNFNNTDEMAGKAAVNRFQTIQTGKAIQDAFQGNVSGGLRRLGYVYGDKSKTVRQNIKKEATNEVRQYQKQLRDKYPATSIAAGITGGVAPFLGGGGIGVQVAKSTRKIPVIAKNAAVGLTAGAASAAGDAKEGEKLKAGIVGGLTGAALGVVAPKVISGSGELVNRVKGKIISKKAVPEVAATKLVEKIISKNPELRQEYLRLKQAGVPSITLADLDRKLANTVGSVARADNGGKARQLAALRGSAMVQEVPSASAKQIAKATGVRRTNNQITKSGNAAKNKLQGQLIRPIENSLETLSPEMQRIIAAPEIRPITRKAASLIATKKSTTGVEPTDALTLEGILKKQGEEFNKPESVSIGGIEDFRGRFESAISTLYDKGDKVLAGQLNDIYKQFLRTPRSNYPDYDDALKIGNTIKSQADAIEDGGKGVFLSQLGDVNDYLKKATPRQARGYRQGAANAIKQRFIDDKNSYELLNRLGAKQDFDMKLRKVFGAKAAEDLSNMAKGMNTRIEAARRVNPNYGSQTAERLNDNSALVDTLLSGKTGIVRQSIQWAVGKLKGLSPEEKLAFVDIATKPFNSSTLSILRRIQQQAEKEGVQLPKSLSTALYAFETAVPAAGAGAAISE